MHHLLPFKVANFS